MLRHIVSGMFFFLVNDILLRFPSYHLRKAVFRVLLRCNCGPQTTIQRGCYVYCRGGITIGDRTMINRGCVLDGRGGLTIGESVNISPHVEIYTADHDPASRSFAERRRPVSIGDYAWISTRAIVLPGLAIGRGAVVAAGSVVVRDVPDYTIVGGVPAKVLGVRRQDLDYSPIWKPFLQ
jgi:acetyltransferase-like isoleucine patch superfamily enzyme